MLALYRFAVLCVIIPLLSSLLAVVGWILGSPDMALSFAHKTLMSAYQWLITGLVSFGLCLLVALTRRRELLRTMWRRGAILAGLMALLIGGYYSMSSFQVAVGRSTLNVIVLNHSPLPISSFTIRSAVDDSNIGPILSGDSALYSVFTHREGRVDYFATIDGHTDSGLIVDYAEPGGWPHCRIVFDSTGNARLSMNALMLLN